LKRIAQQQLLAAAMDRSNFELLTFKGLTPLILYHANAIIFFSLVQRTCQASLE